jgi:hypothetical protein
MGVKARILQTTALQSDRDLMIPRIRAAPSPVHIQTALADSDVSSVSAL